MGPLQGWQRWVPTCMLGTSSSLESLVRLSIRLFQSSRSTVLGAESQVCTGVLQGQGGFYQLLTPTSKPVHSTCHPDPSRPFHPNLLSAWSLCGAGAGPLGTSPCCWEQAQGPPVSPSRGTPQVTGSLPAHTQVLACEPVLALCLGCDAEVGQGLLPPKRVSVPRGLAAPSSEVSQVRAAPGSPWPLVTSSSTSLAPQPPPSDINPLTVSFSTSSFISSAARPAWPCSAAIWWKNLRHFTSTSENCSYGESARGEIPGLEPSWLGASCSGGFAGSCPA